MSELIISKSSFLSAIQKTIAGAGGVDFDFVNSMNIAYDSFRTKDGTTVNSFGGASFKWFCSGKVHKANTFGTNRGFVDQIYIFGEEAPASGGHGRFFALHERTLHMISGVGSGDATQYQGGINGLPADALENMAMIDTGESNHVALMSSPDYGSQTLKLYVGKKGKCIKVYYIMLIDDYISRRASVLTAINGTCYVVHQDIELTVWRVVHVHAIQTF